MIKKLFSVATLSLLLMSCTPSATQLQKVMEDNPDVVFGVIKKHPDKFMEAVQTAAEEAKGKARAKQEEDENAQREKEFANPLQPSVSDEKASKGPKDAPILLVEYSDFQCPFCQRGFKTVEKVLEEYKDKVRFVFKNLPLDFHPLAMPAAKRFEAIAMQSHEKAFKFHDEVFTNQDKLGTDGEKFLDAAAKKAGADMAKMKKDMEGELVKKRIADDMEEAKKFGMSGTPGFIVGGVSVRGAYPFEEFKKIIDKKLGK